VQGGSSSCSFAVAASREYHTDVLCCAHDCIIHHGRCVC
jgi:hypothetical protein